MIRRLEDFDKYVAVAGFRNVQVRDITSFFDVARNKLKNVPVQFFDAKFIAGWKHLYFAALNSLNAFKNKTNISNSVAVETLLYASAQRQIKKAVELLGMKPKSPQVAVLVIAKSRQRTISILETVSELMTGERDDSVLELTDEKVEGVKDLFDISDLELEAKLGKDGFEKRVLVDLVIEHVALLAALR